MHLKTVRDPHDLADWASNGPLKTKSTKVPTRSGRDITVSTTNNDILSGGELPITSVDAFASKERGHNPDDNKAAEPRPLGCAEWSHWPGTDRPLAQDVRLMACSSWPSQATTMQLQPPRDNWMATRDATKALRPREQLLEHSEGSPWPEIGRPPAKNSW
jgi:hypothetical protein